MHCEMQLECAETSTSFLYGLKGFLENLMNICACVLSPWLLF